MSEQDEQPPKAPRHWADLWMCWIGLFPYCEPEDGPPGCNWAVHSSLKDLEAEYTKLEAPHVEEMTRYIVGELSEPSSPEAKFFLGQRFNEVCQFLHSLSANQGSGDYTIIPPSALPEKKIFRWLMIDWWGTHGVRRIAESAIIGPMRMREHEE